MPCLEFNASHTHPQVRIAMGGKLFKAMTGGSLTAPAVKRFITHIMQAGSGGCSDRWVGRLLSLHA